MLSANDFLREIRKRGATRISRVAFRQNRSTVWSLTQAGTVLNVHNAYRLASAELLDAFATVASEGGIDSRASRHAARMISEWPELEAAIREARRAYHTRHQTNGDGRTHCCATPGQRSYLQALYRYFNRTRFADQLPHDLPVRLSHRMRSALGHMLPDDGGSPDRRVVEIALNVDLLLEGNGAERIDTLLHEMAHVADYLATGESGHGASWKEWARRVGCQPTTLYDRPVVSRRRRRDRVTRVPPLPAGLRAFAE